MVDAVTGAAEREARQAILRLIRIHRLAGTLNPGGMEFHHPTAGRLQVPACDFREDLRLIEEWLRNAGLET